MKVKVFLPPAKSQYIEVRDSQNYIKIRYFVLQWRGFENYPKINTDDLQKQKKITIPSVTERQMQQKWRQVKKLPNYGNTTERTNSQLVQKLSRQLHSKQSNHQLNFKN